MKNIIICTVSVSNMMAQQPPDRVAPFVKLVEHDREINKMKLTDLRSDQVLGFDCGSLL